MHDTRMTQTSSEAIIARLLLPDDANPAGNVHGGTILRLMEEAGMITATRYMASSFPKSENGDGNCSIAALVRFETMSFLKPMFVGEVASLSARIVFTSEHSVLVEVVVTAEDVSKGKTRVTNSGQLWYVPLAPGGEGTQKDWKQAKVVQVPQALPPKDEKGRKEYEAAKMQYEKRKSLQNGDNEATSLECLGLDKFRAEYVAPSDGRSPSESEQVLCQIVLPGDCGKGGVAFGGFVMKLMDNCAGCSAFRHCRTNVVTVAISAMDFVGWIKLGDLCTIKSKVVFCSAKSLEIEVVASVSSASAIGEEATVAKGLFSFVSIGTDGKALAVPPLRLETEEDMHAAFLGHQRYADAKRARAARENNKK